MATASCLSATFENADSRRRICASSPTYALRFDSTESFLSELALINTERFSAPGGTVGEDVVMGGEADERVVLSSIHQAKGLEWKAVFMLCGG
jgi:DNA helicase-2/ATP-dependent DNA helicase PcrA